MRVSRSLTEVGAITVVVPHADMLAQGMWPPATPSVKAPSFIQMPVRETATMQLGTSLRFGATEAKDARLPSVVPHLLGFRALGYRMTWPVGSFFFSVMLGPPERTSHEYHSRHPHADPN